jgi:hypothetical protein
MTLSKDDCNRIASELLNDNSLRSTIVEQIAATAAFDGTVESAVSRKMRSAIWVVIFLAFGGIVAGAASVLGPIWNLRDTVSEVTKTAETAAEAADQSLTAAKNAEHDATEAAKEADANRQKIADILKIDPARLEPLQKAIGRLSDGQIDALSNAALQNLHQEHIASMVARWPVMSEFTVPQKAREITGRGWKVVHTEQVAFGKTFEDGTQVKVIPWLIQIDFYPPSKQSYTTIDVVAQKITASGCEIVVKSSAATSFSGARVGWVALDKRGVSDILNGQ